MVELKPGMTVWFVARRDPMGVRGRETTVVRPVQDLVECRVWGLSNHRLRRKDITPLDPASPAGLALAALEQHADGATRRWEGDGMGWSASLVVQPTGEFMARLWLRPGSGMWADEVHYEAREIPARVGAVLRDKIEAAVIVAWMAKQAQAI